jgi:N-acetylneuraminic acid mutarotase
LKKLYLLLAVTLAFLTVSCIFLIPNTKAQAVENSWQEMAPMPTARANLGIAAVDGKIYAIGGDVDGFNVNEMYDPKTNTWTTEQPIPTSRAAFGITVYDNKIYCIGGYTKSYESTKAIEVYDPTTNFWTALSPGPVKGVCKAVTINDKIYIISSDDTAAYLYEFNPATGDWTTKTSMPTPAGGFAVAAIGNKIYVIGGANTEVYFFCEEAIDKVQIYNCNTDSWSYGTPLPDSLSLATAISTSGVYAPQKIYVIGGSSGNNACNSTLAYDPIGNSWSKCTDMITPRFVLGAAEVDDVLYAFGGNIKNQLVAVNERFVPVGYSRADVGFGSDSAFGSLSPVLVVAGVAVAGTVITVTGVVVYHFKHAPSKASKST